VAHDSLPVLDDRADEGFEGDAVVAVPHGELAYAAIAFRLVREVSPEERHHLLAENFLHDGRVEAVLVQW